ncbi:serine/threonine-protein kinase [Arthrobacter sp. B10-11]|uniref:serine/threonine-protein kinase n=1 Tax=Arthrobacter sp. B10-11 TaxID=3081160 RepID=UPI00295460BB|nr:serine/threonine-protein kinase [Arthrobacter sp. B10-11]MDV8148906.1 serine/threonine-protein kinase [Arthrobacter sp. B10-11]
MMTEVAKKQTTELVLGGRYRLLELVGRGAAAGVYRGRDESLGREVAVKLFNRQSADPDVLARQQAEIRILASLNHPSLVTLFDAGSESPDSGDERAYVVMEYVAGPDLRSLIRTSPLSMEQVATIGADLASALDYVHSHGVIHRDVKPGNVLLFEPTATAGTGRWRAKLADFGIARMLEADRLTVTGRTVGTAAYLSPEQAMGEALTGASDVYSLGLVLLECFTGQVEFPGNHVESGIARLQRDPVIPETLSRGWQQVLAHMTARRPEDRPSPADASALLRELAQETPFHPASVARHATPPGGHTARHASLTQPPRRRKLSKRVRGAAGAILAGSLLLGFTTATYGGAPAAPAPPAGSLHTNPLDYHLDELEKTLTP